MNAGQFGAPFRLAGLTFLQYLGISSRTVRHCLKEPLRSKVMSRETLFFNKSVTGGEKTGVASHLPISKSM